MSVSKSISFSDLTKASQALVHYSVLFIALALPVATVSAADKPFPTRVYTLDGSSSEGFAIGKGPTAFNSSPDGSIYKVDLRSGQGLRAPGQLVALQRRQCLHDL